MSKQYLAIYDQKLIARGDLPTIVRKTKAISSEIEPIVLEFDTCKRVDFSWYGDEQTVINGLPKEDPEDSSKRGRPKLGVKSKEVTLLPKHWEWLAIQRGGASVTLRRLVDQAMKNVSIEDQIQIRQNQLYNLMSVLSEQKGFEEATRALYRNSQVSFEQATATWPEDLRALILEKFKAISDMHRGNVNV